MLTQNDAPITHDTLKLILRTLGSSGLKGEHHSFIKFASLLQVQLRMKTLEHIMIDYHFLVEYAVKEVIIEVIRAQLEEARLKINMEHSQV